MSSLSAAGRPGLSAGIYTARAGRSTLLIEKGAIGGQAINTSLVENYPGFEGISGIDLTQAMYRQAKKFGMEETYTEVTGIEIKGASKIVRTSQGDFERQGDHHGRPGWSARNWASPARPSLPARAFLTAPPATALSSGTKR